MAGGGLGLSSSMKMMKRKQVDEVSDDFSDFSLSSPARKIRRLVPGTDLPPIMEEEEASPSSSLPRSFVEEGNGGFINKQPGVRIEELMVPELSPASLNSSYDTNEERAIVLFKPVNNLNLVHSPNSFSVSLDSNIMSGFKNQFLWSSQSGQVKSPEEQETSNQVSDNSMAVVPWAPTQAPSAFVQDIVGGTSNVSQTEGGDDLMEAEEMGEATMEIEEENNNNSNIGSTGQVNQPFGFGGIRAGSDGLPQWQQQHCLIPQIPQNANPTPITWLQ